MQQEEVATILPVKRQLLPVVKQLPPAWELEPLALSVLLGLLFENVVALATVDSMNGSLLLPEKSMTGKRKPEPLPSKGKTIVLGGLLLEFLQHSARQIETTSTLQSSLSMISRRWCSGRKRKATQQLHPPNKLSWGSGRSERIVPAIRSRILQARAKVRAGGDADGGQQIPGLVDGSIVAL